MNESEMFAMRQDQIMINLKGKIKALEDKVKLLEKENKDYKKLFNDFTSQFIKQHSKYKTISINK